MTHCTAHLDYNISTSAAELSYVLDPFNREKELARRALWYLTVHIRDKNSSLKGKYQTEKGRFENKRFFWNTDNFLFYQPCV